MHQSHDPKNAPPIFRDWPVEIRFSSYTNNRTAILLRDPRSGELIAKATTNLHEHDMSPDEVAIKDHSENEGMLAFLVGQRIVSEPVRFIRSGFVEVPVCRLLVEPSGT